MFTGLVAGSRARSRGRRGPATASRLRVRTRAGAASSREGDSVAVNGVCLTATAIARRRRSRADVMHETLRRSSLGRAGREGDASTSSSRCAPPTGSAATSCRATSTALGRGRGVARGRLRARGDGRGARRAAALRRREGLDRRRRRRRSPSRASTTTRFDGLADPRDARAHDARHGRAGRAVNLEVDVWPSTSRSWSSARRAPAARRPLRHDRGGASRTSAPAGWSSSATTRTARTRATSTIAAAVRDARGDQLHGQARGAG